MNLTGIKKLQKLKASNQGNVRLKKAIDKLIQDILENDWKTPIELIETRPDADNVHSDGFYFFNLNVHRTMILIEFEDGEATIEWVGTHQEYERTFKNNKAVIKRWLKHKDLI